MAELTDEERNRLTNDLIKLGDMMGDGLHLEPDGKWISSDYKKICRALGYIKSTRTNNSERINQLMARRISEVKCGKCNSELKQNRSGSKRAVCVTCGAKWILLK